MAHATSEEYATYTDSDAPAGIGLMLTRASRDVDLALLTSVYDVDDNGVATGEKVLAALRDATIEQVNAWVVAGEDGTGVTPIYGNVSIGSVTLGGRTSGSGGASGGAGARPLAPQAWQVLQLAGLTGHSPYTYLFRDC